MTGSRGDPKKGVSASRESLDQNHDVLIFHPIMRLRSNHYRCQVIVLCSNGELTQSSFIGDGKTEYQAREAALSKARQAIRAGRIMY